MKDPSVRDASYHCGGTRQDPNYRMIESFISAVLNPELEFEPFYFKEPQFKADVLQRAESEFTEPCPKDHPNEIVKL